MSKFKYTEFEHEMNTVLKHQNEVLSNIHFPSDAQTDSVISKAEELLRLLGKDPQDVQSLPVINKATKVITVPTWEELVQDAERHVGSNYDLESIFTEEELQSNEAAIRQMREEYNTLHRLDGFDISIVE